jgi:hypothetical protein
MVRFPAVSGALLPAIAIAVMATAAEPGPPRDLDAVVARAMREFDVPGLALAVVKDGRPVVLKGYGVRRLGSSTPVDAETLFAIASNTKAFTATSRRTGSAGTCATTGEGSSSATPAGCPGWPRACSSSPISGSAS